MENSTKLASLETLNAILEPRLPWAEREELLGDLLEWFFLEKTHDRGYFNHELVTALLKECGVERPSKLHYMFRPLSSHITKIAKKERMKPYVTRVKVPKGMSKQSKTGYWNLWGPPKIVDAERRSAAEAQEKAERERREFAETATETAKKFDAEGYKARPAGEYAKPVTCPMCKGEGAVRRPGAEREWPLMCGTCGGTGTAYTKH